MENGTKTNGTSGPFLAVHTLASLQPEVSPPQSPRNKGPNRVGLAVVTACSVTHEQKRGDKPRPTVRLGGIAVIDHILIGLCAAGLERALVLVADQADEVIKTIKANQESLYPSLKVEVVALGETWSDSVGAALLEVSQVIDGDFLAVPGDHIYETKLYSKMARTELGAMGAAMLVETDLEGMVGLPKTIIQVALRPLDDPDLIFQLGWNLPGYNGIDAGMSCCSPRVLTALRTMSENRPYFTLADALQMMAKDRQLKLVTTGGKTWFSVETQQTLEYSKNNVTKLGQAFKLDNGEVVHLLGHPKKVKTSPSTGGDWAEFSVEKWRNAVFTTKSYFAELYEDTTDCVRKYCKQLGGTDNVCLIEVGCGTGEALVPLFDDVKYVIGLDINPDFVKFCRNQTPPSYADKVSHICGDATKLSELLGTGKTGPWLKECRKVVICVGNTLGIIPEPAKTAIYKSMVELAGEDGVVLVVYWNGNCFGDAIQHFYHKNPQLCGSFTGADVDYESCSLKTPSGYNTHWTTPEEAESVISSLGCDKVEVAEIGRGVLSVFKQRQ